MVTKSFDRGECLAIYLALVQASPNRGANALLDQAKEMAKDFHQQMGGAAFPLHKPTYSVGRYYASDNCLFQETSDGVQLFQAEYATNGEAVEMAIALNEAFRVPRSVGEKH